MKILWLANVPSPYRVDFFNKLGEFCDLTVLFEKRTSSERDSSWKCYQFKTFNGIILKGISTSVDTAFCPSVISYILDKTYDYIIITNFTDFTGMLAISIMRKLNIKYWLESDGGFAKDGKGFVEKVKKYFIKRAELYLSTGKSHDEYYLQYGAERERIVHYPFSSVSKEDVIKSPLTMDEKWKIKKKLGIQEEKVVLAIGQFIYRKGFDILLKASTKFNKKIGIYFIGGKPSEKYLELVKENNVYFKEFMCKDEIWEFYKVADVFVLPTREDIWGLVINEAFACGTPVVSTDRCGAAIQLIENGKNGYVVSTNDEKKLREKIEKILQDNELKTLMSCNALRTAQENTIEAMAQCHMNIFEKMDGYKEKIR